MKTLVKLSPVALVAALFATAGYTAFAQNPPALPTPTCSVMSNLNLGSAKGPQWIRCTPETMQKDPRCRALCESVRNRAR